MIAERLKAIQQRIIAACKNAARSPGEVSLVAVSKKQPATLINEYLELCKENCSKVAVAENYVQEMESKKPEIICASACDFHLIGPLQSNKVKKAVQLFDVVQSVHSEKILQALEREAKATEKKLKVFLQVNISYDSAKSGFLPEEILANYPALISGLEYLDLQGLMAITALHDEPELSRNDFRELRRLRDELDPRLSLSMGMSQDFEIAIEEGATHVRIGSALFGDRQILSE